MENASKALLMAGGVLIAMAIIGIAVAVYSHATDFARDNENAMSTSQIESFNRFYTAYTQTHAGITTIKCIDAVNILNRALEDDIRITENSALITRVDDISQGMVYRYYKADSADYLKNTIKYSLEYNPALGVVEGVVITD